MKRTKHKKIQPPHGTLGGHMPDPPNDCSATKTQDEHGRIYINMMNCQCKKLCERRKEFDQEWKDYYHKYKKKRGLLDEKNNP